MYAADQRTSLRRWRESVKATTCKDVCVCMCVQLGSLRSREFPKQDASDVKCNEPGQKLWIFLYMYRAFINITMKIVTFIREMLPNVI